MKNAMTHILKMNATQPILTGFFTVLLTVGFGMSLAFATGFVTPSQVFAQFVSPCCVVVPPPPPPPPPVIIPAVVIPIVPPTCTLSASPTTLPLGGGASTLSWSTVAATSATIDNGVGSVSPVEGGTKGVTLTATKTYTMTVSGPGGSTTCSTKIIVTPPPAPTCTLTASPTTIASGASSTLSWTTTNAVSFVVDHAVGSVTPVAAGSKSVSPTVTTTYTGTATSGSGVTVNCTAKVTVTVITNAPTCTLTANPTSITKGSSSLLSWTTTNATSFSINQSIGSVTPVAAGSKSVSPTVTTTYTGTAVGPDGTVNCTATITVTTTNPGDPSCTLSASPTVVNSGDHTTLTWTTTNGNMFSIDKGVGDVTPVSGGSVSSKAITADTTFTGTVTSGTGFVATCTAVVTVNTGGGGGGGPTCTMTVSPTSTRSGNSATLTWGGSDILNVDIDNGIATATTSPGSITVAPSAVGSYTYKGTFHAKNGQTLTCSATLVIEGGSGGCTSNCGGGSNPPPKVVLASLPHVGSQPFVSYLYLSQVPYTGLDLGFWGTGIYWSLLIVWSVALAYLVLFGAIPYLARAGRTFGERVSEMVNAVEIRQTVPPMPAAPFVQKRTESTERHDAPEAPQSYSTFDGFKSFATSEALSIDDIVKGLARSTAQAIHRESHNSGPERANIEEIYDHVEPIYDNVEPIAENVEPIYDHVEPIEESVAQRAQPKRTPQAAAAVPAEIPAFLEALLCGNRDEVFGMTREVVRNGGSSEAFLTQATCALDDAYRARLEGTPVHKDIEKLTAGGATPVLERVVTALSTAVDSSYSVGITGAKVALTRALAVLGA